MERIKPRTLSGFMELLPAQQQQMERVMDILRTTYSRYGFTPLDTPIIEASEILLAKGGGETEKQIYRFSKGDSDLSLRFDLTVPLAKYVALHYNKLAFPFRRFQIRINNRRVLNGFYSMLGLTEQSGEIMRTVDKIEKIGPDMVRAILVDDVKLTDEQADEILKFIFTTKIEPRPAIIKMNTTTNRTTLTELTYRLVGIFLILNKRVDYFFYHFPFGFAFNRNQLTFVVIARCEYFALIIVWILENHILASRFITVKSE